MSQLTPPTDEPIGALATTPEPTPAPTSGRRKAAISLTILAAVAAVLLSVSLLSLDDEAPESKPRLSPLADAKVACASGDDAVRLADGGITLIIDGEGREDSGASIQTEACVLSRLGVPAAVIAKIDGTNALAGRQEASWAGFTVSWTYHPDNGLDLIIQAR